MSRSLLGCPGVRATSSDNLCATRSPHLVQTRASTFRPGNQFVRYETVGVVRMAVSNCSRVNGLDR
jgi:hypothetical protein